MRFLRTAVLPAALVLLAAPAFADELIHFTNGTVLPVEHHTIKDGMIRVVLGDDAVMAFPEYLVERIEGAKNVAGDGYSSNLRRGDGKKGSSGGAFQAIQDFSAIPEVEFREQRADLKVDPKTGLLTHRPFASSSATNRRAMQTAGSQAALNHRMPAVKRNGYRRPGGRAGGGAWVDKNAGRDAGAATKQKVSHKLGHPDPLPPPASQDSGSSAN